MERLLNPAVHSEIADAPIFVVGPPRCGTTLTARLLGQLPTMFMPGETHFLEDIYHRRRELGAPDSPEGPANIAERLRTIYARYNEIPDQRRIDRLTQEADLRQMVGMASGYAGVMQVFMELQMQSEGRSRWGNQVPRDVFEIDLLKKMFPRARFIFCVRDPRDFLVSYRDKWKVAVSEDNARRLRALYHPLLTSIIWRNSVRAGLAATERWPGEVMISRYEDLVADPDAAMTKVCDFIGEPFSPSLLQLTFSNSSTGQAWAGVSASSVGRWRGLLGPEEAAIAQEVNGQFMQALGYELVVTRASSLKLAAILATAPFRAAAALHANRAKRGSTFGYLARRLGLMR